MKKIDLSYWWRFLREGSIRIWFWVKYQTKYWINIPKEQPFWIKGMQATLYGFAFFLILLLLVDINFLWLFGKSPNLRAIKNPDINYTSEYYSSDGKLLGTLFIEDRKPVAYDDLSTNLTDALIATEDVRFYKHHGIDVRATFAAIFSTTVKGDKRGGSTITQQLVKNLFKTRGDYSRGLLGYIPFVGTMISKTKEWINALKIELYYSKEDIIEMYFNTVDFGNNAFGINSAAAIYFNKRPSQLNQTEAAMLVGLLKAPSYYSPVSQPDRSRERRNQVLNQLAKYKYIEKSTADSLKKMPLGLKINKKKRNTGEGSFLRDAIARELQEWSKETGYDVWSDGLKIYTTIDSRMQNYAEEAVLKHLTILQDNFDRGGSSTTSPWKDEKGALNKQYVLEAIADVPAYKELSEKLSKYPDSLISMLSVKRKMKVFSYRGDKEVKMSVIDSILYYKKFFQSGFIAIEPQSREIKAWVGGVNYKYFKYDHVKQSKRQPGSIFKAFDYAAAFDAGFGPCDKMIDKPQSIKYKENGVEKVWEPKNVDRSHRGSMTLKHAFARSVNSIAVQLADTVGWEKVIDYAYNAGITTELERVPAVCLGSSDVSLYEIVNAYCTFINEGLYEAPKIVTRIEDKDGNVIFEAKSEPKQKINIETAFLVTELLRAGLTEPGGTTQGLFEYDIFRFNTDFGGKTGTSSDYTDGWFIGVTPGLVAGCWTGNDDRTIHFTTSHTGEGLRTALPVYGRFMEKVLKDNNLKQYRQRFPKPDFKISKTYNCQTSAPRRDTIQQSGDSAILEENN